MIRSGAAQAEPLRPQRSQGPVFQAMRIAFALLGNLNHPLCDDLGQRVRSIHQLQLTQGVLERRGYDFDVLWIKRASLQCPRDRHDTTHGTCRGREPAAFPIIATPLRPMTRNPRVIAVATARKIGMRNAVGSKAVAMMPGGWRNRGALLGLVVGMPNPCVN